MTEFDSVPTAARAELAEERAYLVLKHVRLDILMDFNDASSNEYLLQPYVDR